MRNPSYIYAKAFQGYKKLAAQGNPDSQRYLGMMYENGQGVPKNCLEASRWYEKAAAKGDLEAILRLGLLYANGRGVTKNFIKACKLFMIALNLGDKNAEKLLEQLTPKMDENQIAKAKKLANDWKASEGL